MSYRIAALFVLAAGFSIVASGQVAVAQKRIGRVSSPDAPQTDKSALSSAKLKAEEPDGLVAYFKQRTLSDDELTKIKAVISRMGSDVFEDRERASTDVLGFGPAAIGPLKTAAQAEADPEVNYRAEQARKKIETVSHAAVASAAARALAKATPKHPQAVSALLGFLPLADDESVVEDIERALVQLAEEGGKPDPALLAALSDKAPVRRTAAVVALLDGGDLSKPIRFPEAIGPVKAALASDADAEVKFRGLYTLLTRAKDKDAVAGIINLLPALPRGRLWQADDFLTQLAGKDAPKARFGKSKESQDKAVAEWVKWWTGAKDKTDLTAFKFTPKTTGSLLILEMDARGYGTGKVLQLSPAMKEQWVAKGLQYPSDVAVFPDGRVVIVEQNASRLTVRDKTGATLNTVNVNMPMSCEVTPTGTLLVVGRNDIYEMDAKWNAVPKFGRGNHDMVAGRRLPNGETIVLTTNQPNNVLKLDKNWKVVGKEFKLGLPYYMAQMSLVSDTEVLITEQNQVAQYDLKDEKNRDKPTWKKSIPNPTSAQRLGNGNTLIVSQTQNRVVEVAPDGEELWEWQPTDGLRLQRAYRR